MLLLGSLSRNLLAQHEPLFSQYMFNMVQVNPAYAGSTEKCNATLMYRKQWVGFDGGPVIQSFNVNTPLSHNRIGLGIQLLNETQKIHKRFSLNIAYSYKIKIRKGMLAFGLYGGLQQSSIDYSKLAIKDADDKVGINRSIIPDFGAGAYYHKKKYYAGLSVRHLMNLSHLSETASLSYRQHLYGTAGYRHTLSSRFELIPSCLVKYTAGAPVQIDLTGHIKYDEKIWAGLSYRSADAMSLQAGIDLGKLINRTQYDIKMGYAYDMSFSTLQPYHKGSHELMLSANFGWGKTVKQLNKKKTLVSPLFF